MKSLLKTGIKTLKDELLSLVFKPNCPLCDRPADVELCEYCYRQLCHCQLKTPTQLWRGELPVFVWGSYNGIVKRAIAALKYENQPQLARLLGEALGQVWLNSSAISRNMKLTVVPIPLHSQKQQQRGFNQAELIAKRFCDVTGYKQQPQGLERVRLTQAQFSLSPQQREQNLADAFTLGRDFQKRHPTSPILLVDDIYTTGATVRSAAQSLRQHGMVVYGVAAVAASRTH